MILSIFYIITMFSLLNLLFVNVFTVGFDILKEIKHLLKNIIQTSARMWFSNYTHDYMPIK